MSKITIHTIVPNYPCAFTQDLEAAIAKARMKADETNDKQVVFEGSAYCWYGFMSLEEWQKLNEYDQDELCKIQVIKPRELEEERFKAIVGKASSRNLSMDQLDKLEAFLSSI